LESRHREPGPPKALRYSAIALWSSNTSLIVIQLRHIANLASSIRHFRYA